MKRAFVYLGLLAALILGLSAGLAGCGKQAPNATNGTSLFPNIGM